jgi:hypothetical protein
MKKECNDDRISRRPPTDIRRRRRRRRRRKSVAVSKWKLRRRIALQGAGNVPYCSGGRVGCTYSLFLSFVMSGCFSSPFFPPNVALFLVSLSEKR